MAKHSRPLLLLLLFLTATVSLTGPTPTTSPIPTPSAGSTRTRTHTRDRIHNRTSPTTKLLPPIRPSRPPPPQHAKDDTPRQQQLNNIIDALIGAGDFNSWANILSVANPSYLPLSATFFIPADDSLVAAPANTFTDPFIFPYHIVPQRISFAELRQFKPLSRLPTLLASKSILLTNNSISNFTLDDSLLSHPDLFISPAIVVHGIANLMDYSVYGDATVQTSEPQPQPQVSGKSPPGLFVPAGEMIGSHPEPESGAGCLCTDVWSIFLVIICAVLASKTQTSSLWSLMGH